MASTPSQNSEGVRPPTWRWVGLPPVEKLILSTPPCDSGRFWPKISFRGRAATPRGPWSLLILGFRFSDAGRPRGNDARRAIAEAGTVDPAAATESAPAKPLRISGRDR